MEANQQIGYEENVYQKPVISPVQKLRSAINLAQRLPPSKLTKNIVGLINLVPELQINLLEKIDIPLKIERQAGGRQYLTTQFNREGDSYRSPYTNKYYPNVQGYQPSGQYRRLQQTGGILFDQYTKLYYGSGTVSNFYISEGQRDGCFSCGFFAKKQCGENQRFKGNWDSFNIVDVIDQGKKTYYKLTCTVLLQMKIDHKHCGKIDLTGYLKKQKQVEKQLKVGSNEQKFDCHLVTVGQMIEELQTQVRQYLEAVYIARTKQVIFNSRLQQTVQMQDNRRKLAMDLKNLKFKAAQ